MNVSFAMIVVVMGFQEPSDLDEFKRMSAIRPKHYMVRKIATPISIDGKLDDKAWQKIPFTDHFVDIEGDAKPKPRFETRMKLAWDDHFLYVGADLKEPHVWGTLTKRDSVIFHDNDFEIFIDPDGDNHQYYEFEMNALNTGWDLRLVKPYKDGGPALNEWNIAGIKTAVHIDGSLNDPSDVDRGWSLEIALPWESLREFAGNRSAPPRVGDYWRFNASRVEWQTDIKEGKYVKRSGIREDNWVWSAQGVIDMHRPEKWGWLQFSDGTNDGVRRDGAESSRETLMEIYYRQRAYRAKRGQYARDLKELFEGPHPEAEFPHLVLETKPDGKSYRCTVNNLGGGNVKKLTITDDRRIVEHRVVLDNL